MFVYALRRLHPQITYEKPELVSLLNDHSAARMHEPSCSCASLIGGEVVERKLLAEITDLLSNSHQGIIVSDIT